MTPTVIDLEQARVAFHQRPTSLPATHARMRVVVDQADPRGRIISSYQTHAGETVHVIRWDDGVKRPLQDVVEVGDLDVGDHVRLTAAGHLLRDFRNG